MMVKAAWYVREYRNWQIFCVREGFLQKPAMRMIPLYVGVCNQKIILGVDLPDLLADIDEAIL